MTTLYKISIFCPDRMGLISAVTGKLFDLGANLGDTAFAVLGSGAEFTIVCEVPTAYPPNELQQQLASLDELSDADISIKAFELAKLHGPTAKITHYITVKGGDHPGLVARLSEVFVQFQANIVRLNTETIPHTSGQQYIINIAVWIPLENSNACLATIENTANSLQMDCQVRTAKA